MKIEFKAYVWRKISLQAEKFPNLLEVHIHKVKDTKEIEKKGALIVKNDFNNWEKTEDFIKSVCGWGNYSGVYGRVVKNNKRSDIVETLITVKRNILSKKPNLMKAIDTTCKIYGLGVPFASKHLRFLFPKLCPVLDNELADYLDYELSPEDYQKFANFCMNLSKELNESKILNPFPGRKNWYPCDAEASLFSYFRDWN